MVELGRVTLRASARPAAKANDLWKSTLIGRHGGIERAFILLSALRRFLLRGSPLG